MPDLTRHFQLYTAAYVVLAVACMIAALLEPPTALMMVFKGLPVALLVVVTARANATVHGRYRFYILLGLVASVAGDVIIEVLFVGGLAAFLLAHVFYLVAMRALPLHPFAVIAGAVLGAGVMALLLPEVPRAMFIPVLVYMGVILLMLVRAWSRLAGNRPAGASWMAAGATLFVISDSLIGLNRWVFDIPLAGAAILTTYFAAQWLICRSALSPHTSAARTF